uniref:COX assembly mitochondrial protein n=1 Tax=Bigelowiella natans TaxID=227086 RepID=A0A7S2KI90_BIGNA|eukprot:jgi/Bigna1/129657/aug1.9_g4365
MAAVRARFIALAAAAGVSAAHSRVAKARGLERPPRIWVSPVLLQQFEEYIGAGKQRHRIGGKIGATVGTAPDDHEEDPRFSLDTVEDQQETRMIHELKDKFGKLEHNYHEELVAATCTKEEYDILQCYSKHSLTPRKSSLECAGLMNSYQKCVSELRK